MAEQKGIAILGIYVADTAYLAGRMPKKRYADPSSPLSGLI